jgi:hypothetical protein
VGSPERQRPPNARVSLQPHAGRSPEQRSSCTGEAGAKGGLLDPTRTGSVANKNPPNRAGKAARGRRAGAWGLDGTLGEAWGQPSPAPFRRILLRRRPGCGEIVAVGKGQRGGAERVVVIRKETRSVWSWHRVQVRRLRQIGADLRQQLARTIGLADVTITTRLKRLALITGQGIGRNGDNRYGL